METTLNVFLFRKGLGRIASKTIMTHASGRAITYMSIIEAETLSYHLPGQDTSGKLVSLLFKLLKSCSMTKQQCDHEQVS